MCIYERQGDYKSLKTVGNETQAQEIFRFNEDGNLEVRVPGGRLIVDVRTIITGYVANQVVDVINEVITNTSARPLFSYVSRATRPLYNLLVNRNRNVIDQTLNWIVIDNISVETQQSQDVTISDVMRVVDYVTPVQYGSLESDQFLTIPTGRTMPYIPATGDIPLIPAGGWSQSYNYNAAGESIYHFEMDFEDDQHVLLFNNPGTSSSRVEMIYVPTSN